MKHKPELSIDIQVEILSPLLIAQAEKLTKVFSQAMKRDLSKAHWWFVSDEKTKTDFLKPYVIEKAEEDFQSFFQNKKPLFFCADVPDKGLVNKDPRFWIFFDPKIASGYFFKQNDKPDKFDGSVIKRFPVLPLYEELMKHILAIFHDKGERPVLRLKKLEEALELSDCCLPEEDAVKFAEAARKALVTLTLLEVQDLSLDIKNPGVTPESLERRLSAVFRLCVRLYASNHEEIEILKKLLSPKTQIRQKALDLVGNKLENDIG